MCRCGFGNCHVTRLSKTPPIGSSLMDPQIPHTHLLHQRSQAVYRFLQGLPWSPLIMHLPQLSRPPFFIKIIIKKYIDYSNYQVVNNYQSHPRGLHHPLSPRIMSMSRSLNAQFIHQRYGHASHQRIIQMAKLGIYTGLPKSTLKLSCPCCACILSKRPHLSCHPNLSIENLYTGTCFRLDFSLSNKVSCRKFTSTLTIVDATTMYLFWYSTRSKCPPIQLIKPFIQFSCNHGCKISIFRAGEGG